MIGAIEAGGTKFRCAIGQENGTLVRTITVPTTSPGETLGRVATFFNSQKDTHPIAKLGIASFGPLDLGPNSPSYGHITTTPKPFWRDVDMVGRLREDLSVETVAIDSDVNGACLAEYLWGAGRGVDVLTYVTVGTGIGAGVVIGGRPLHGLVHPEFGHIRIPHDRTLDPFTGACPVHGTCLEGLASGRAIAERWATDPMLLSDDHPAWPMATEYIAVGLANLVCTLSPQRIILGGGIAGRLELDSLGRRLRELIGGYLRTPALTDESSHYLVRPALGGDAGVLGALALAGQSSNGTAPSLSSRLPSRSASQIRAKRLK